MKFMRILLPITICCVAIVGDYIVLKCKYSESFLFRAISDNTVHALIGMLSAMLFMDGIDLTKQAYFYNVAFCTIISSFIDLDHFLVAKSVYIKDLMSLKERGIFHCTTLWLLITLVLLLYSYIYQKLNIYLLTYMITIAYTSHHIRDSTRRGIWLYPFGHTVPLNKYLYIFVTATLPLVLSYLHQCYKPGSKNTNIHYSMLV
ncbi:transmembrane protein 267 [Leptidea sinapis]|uniref:transmembrane protein 267 n=1 Tax=Leptidea sinapis TaxID=189913 RepID=UPI0021404E6A|nr:transmembrane protein 267 [Leptidea sinapis]